MIQLRPLMPNTYPTLQKWISTNTYPEIKTMIFEIAHERLTLRPLKQDPIVYKANFNSRCLTTVFHCLWLITASHLTWLNSTDHKFTLELQELHPKAKHW